MHEIDKTVLARERTKGYETPIDFAEMVQP